MRFVEETDGKSFVQVNDGTKKEEKEYASKGVAGTALGLGIAGTALWLLNGGLNGCGLFGRNCGGATAAEVAISSNEQYLERKECEDMVALTNAMWQRVYNEQGQRFNDRQVINQEMFGIYSAMRNGFDVINAKHNQDAFDLYKYSRDSKDELAGEIGALRTEVAVLKASRGQIFTVEDAKAIYDKHVRNINREITYWDVYVAVNAQYHDYIRMYKQWFPNLTEEQLDEKIIHSAINFWFEDEDAGSGKVWNYFKNI